MGQSRAKQGVGQPGWKKDCKVANSASPATFLHWLIQQTERVDIVGDLARDAIKDPNRPRGNSGYTAWKRYFENLGAVPGALEAFREAWREYGGRVPQD
jgi:uncharacterized protein YozE (UPF0346 family)